MTEDSNKFYDVVIVGGGPAGLSAALYAGRDNASVLLIEKGFLGGQIGITDSVENYPGVLAASGSDLIDTMYQQAIKFGAEFETADVLQIENVDAEHKRVITDIGEFESKTVLIATGAKPRMAGFENEEMFKGRGVSYCATCDGMFYKDKEVYVVGGGLAALEEAIFLTNYVNKVNLIVRKDAFRAPTSVSDEVLKNEKIEVFYNTKIKSISGGFSIEEIVLESTNSDDMSTKKYEPGSIGIFVFVGYEPQTELLVNYADFDEFGMVKVDNDQMTRTEGIYAAGDICTKRLRQVVTATADGAVAATAITKSCQYI